ncbi:MAG: DegT/DnrJ/EryC1/StrS aminotransferase family protein [Candidatus Methanomethylicaceae archaeon]
MKIPITNPYITEEEKDYLLKPLETGWLVQGPYVREFERLFSEFTGAKYAVATSSCTTALHLALIACGVGKNDRVILPSFTFVASANVIEYVGAIPVFCDIDLRTFNIDVNHIDFILRKRKNIKAIIPVNLFGLCADLPSIIHLASRKNLIVIEDSACGFDSWIGDKHSGTFGHAGCFSFHPRKVITTGEGGMVITDREDIAKTVQILRDHGASKTDLLRHQDKYGFLLPEYNVLGYNYRMTDLQGALGVAQMHKAKRILQRRREVALRYLDALKDLSSILLPYTPSTYQHSFQSFVCLYTGGQELQNLRKGEIDKLAKKRERAMYLLAERGIATRQGTHAVHRLGYYKNKYNINDLDYPNSYLADRLSVSLPLYVMNDHEIDYVIENVKEVFSKLD